jgi:hypothetical protein
MDAITAIENLIRRLSSIEERKAELDEQGAPIRTKLLGLLEAHVSNKAETIYGRVNIKEEKVYDYSSNPDVALAMEAVEVAKAQLKAAQKAAQSTSPFTIKRTLVFYRNKAVSARAKGKRVYIRSFLRLRKSPKATTAS